MKNIKSKRELKNKIKESGLKICLSRSPQYNSFNLIHEDNGGFVVNFAPDQDINEIFRFVNRFRNLAYSINQ